MDVCSHRKITAGIRQLLRLSLDQEHHGERALHGQAQSIYDTSAQIARILEAHLRRNASTFGHRRDTIHDDDAAEQDADVASRETLRWSTNFALS